MSDQTQNSDVIIKATRSVKWAALTEIISRTATPMVTVVLARFLSPEDFGIVATAMVVISFGQMLWDAGLSKALIQTEEDAEDAAHVVFWTNLVLGCVIYLALLVSAPGVAVFFSSPASASVLRVLGLTTVISALTSVQTSLYIRDMNFRRLMWVKLLTAFVPGLFSIPMAMVGYGVWALVAGSLVGQTLNLILLWHHSHWRPAFRYDFRLARKLIRFGAWILMEAVAGWFQVWGDSLVVGKFLGVKELGVYRLGWTVSSMIYDLVLSPMQRIVYPAFSRMQNDREALIHFFHKAIRLSIAITIPVGLGLFLTGAELSDVLFDGKWEGLGSVIGVIGLMLAIGSMTGLNQDIYRALGKPHVNAIFTCIQLCYYLPAYYFAAQQGLFTFIYVRLAVCIVALPMNIYLCRRMLGTAWNYLWVDGRSSFIAVAAMGMLILLIKMLMHNAVSPIGQSGMLLVIIPTGIATYLGLLMIFDGNFIKSTFRLIKQAAVI